MCFISVAYDLMCLRWVFLNLVRWRKEGGVHPRGRRSKT